MLILFAWVLQWTTAKNSATFSTAGWKRTESKIWTSQSGTSCMDVQRCKRTLDACLHHQMLSTKHRCILRSVFPLLHWHRAERREQRKLTQRGRNMDYPELFSVNFPSLLLDSPCLSFRILTICCACFQNVVNVLLKKFLYLFSFKQRHTNAALHACRIWSCGLAKDWRKRTNEYESNSRRLRNDVL